MRIIRDSERKEVITNDLVKVFYRIIDYKEKKDLLKIFDVLRRIYSINCSDHILCKGADGTVLKEYHHTMKEWPDNLTEEDVKKITHYIFQN